MGREGFEPSTLGLREVLGVSAGFCRSGIMSFALAVPASVSAHLGGACCLDVARIGRSLSLAIASRCTVQDELIDCVPERKHREPSERGPILTRGECFTRQASTRLSRSS